MFVKINKNPKKKVVNKNIVSAVAVLFCLSWQTAKEILEYIGKANGEEPFSLATLDLFFRTNDFYSCNPYCCNDVKKCNVSDFADEHKEGRFMLLTNDHVVPVIDGIYLDYYDSKDEMVIMYWSGEDVGIL